MISDSSDEEVFVPPPPPPPSIFHYAYPFKCIMHNLPTVENHQGIALAWSVDWVIDTLHICGLTKAENIRPAYEMDGSFLRYAVIVFGGDEESLTQALNL